MAACAGLCARPPLFYWASAIRKIYNFCYTKKIPPRRE